MNTQIIMILDSVKYAEKKAYDDLNELYSHNKSDSPVFSQIGSIYVHIDHWRESENIRDAEEAFQRLVTPPDSFLLTRESDPGYWDDAPMDLVKKTQQSWKAYKSLVKSIMRFNPIIKRMFFCY